MMETDLLQTYFTSCLLGFLQSVGRFGDHGSRSTPKLRSVSSQYQYRETDWEFLKRVASRLGMPLVAALIGALTGGVGGYLKGVEILANPYADMAIKEVIESCVATRAGIAVRSLESMGMPPGERLAYIYNWKMLTLDFGLGTVVGIGLGSTGIAFRGAAGEAVEQAAKEGMEEMLEDTADAAARVAKEGDIGFSVGSKIKDAENLFDNMSIEDQRRYVAWEQARANGITPDNPDSYMRFAYLINRGGWNMRMRIFLQH